MPAVEIRDLVVRYGDRVAVDGVSFSVEPGELVVLLGPNGAGKTTAVETLEGYRRPASGTVRVLGLDPIGDRAALMPRLGVMLQRGGVYPSMGPQEALRLFGSYYADPADAEELLARVGLPVDVWRTPWRRLSGGEQQRVSLALALVGRPQVALLDEPSAGVDLAGRQRIRQVVAELRDSGVAILLTTHDLDDAERLADRVVIIDRGRVVADGRPDELRSSQGGDALRFGASAAIDVDALGRHLGTAVEQAGPGEYVVRGTGSPAMVASLTAWLAERDLALDDLRSGRGSLEDVFSRLTTGEDSAAARPPSGRRRRGWR